MTQYRYQVERDRGKELVSDFWSAELFLNLKEKGLFPDDTDIGFMLSTDGVKVFKFRRNFSIWPILLINLNLPPAIRFKHRNMLLIGFIPGPNNPKDIDSFMFPLVQEFLQMERGIPGVWNSSRQKRFTLRAHICVIGADMPGREKLMNFKGNRTTCYCPYCYIQGIHNRGIYCPLKPPLNSSQPQQWKTYEPSQLPMRNDDQTRKIAAHVVQTGDDNVAKKYGIKGLSCLYQLSSIDLPRSFPPDAMHLWWENIIPDLVEHWRGKFFSDIATAQIHAAGQDDQDSAPAKPSMKKFHKTRDLYNIPPDIWEDIGRDMLASAPSFPALFGDPIRDFTEHCHHFKAAEWKTFAFLLAPIYLKDNLPEEDYSEFINIIDAVQLCYKNELTLAEINVVESRITRFIEYYERWYYGQKWERLPACLPVFHQALHVANGIRWAGPMFVYWQWPMERVCGMIAATAKSKVSANRNMAITMVLNERRNHLPYVLPKISNEDDVADGSGQYEDEDGNILLHRLFTKRLDKASANQYSKDIQHASFSTFHRPTKPHVLSNWQRRALKGYFQLQHDVSLLTLGVSPSEQNSVEIFDHQIALENLPMKCMKWSSYTPSFLENTVEKWCVTSSQMRRVNSTRNSSMIMYNMTLADGSVNVSFGEVLFFFTVDFDSQNESEVIDNVPQRPESESRSSTDQDLEQKL
ncbi:uncharacterized protein H6S33_007165 [Morchella sextelata]|uniref:uncharacterized protein n=1 Tax=Morchella sextelata TaxID=1174677 RepID=UPI001D04F322|nr:uncharacterized protein H6S33_007165 [Morchella sextelata]KAH0604134.1 hypothetical protein H6S33_007165 [Morchella sextelata]